MSVTRLEEIVVETDPAEFISVSWWSIITSVWRGYVSDGNNLVEVVRDEIGQCSLKDFPKLSVCATDIRTEELVILSNETAPDMEIAMAIRSSISLPWLFSAVPWRETWLVDGGLAKNYPIDVAAEVIEDRPIIGCLIESSSQGLDHEPKLWDWPMVVVNSLMQANTRESQDDVDDLPIPLPIRTITVPVSVGLTDFDLPKTRREELLLLGYAKTTQRFPVFEA